MATLKSVAQSLGVGGLLCTRTALSPFPRGLQVRLEISSYSYTCEQPQPICQQPPPQGSTAMRGSSLFGITALGEISLTSQLQRHVGTREEE